MKINLTYKSQNLRIITILNSKKLKREVVLYEDGLNIYVYKFKENTFNLIYINMYIHVCVCICVD